VGDEDAVECLHCVSRCLGAPVETGVGDEDAVECLQYVSRCLGAPGEAGLIQGSGVKYLISIKIVIFKRSNYSALGILKLCYLRRLLQINRWAFRSDL
jgi:hypothetical protein